MTVKRKVRATFILKLSPMKTTEMRAYISRANCRPSVGSPATAKAGNWPVAYIRPKNVYDRKKEPYCRQNYCSDCRSDTHQLMGFAQKDVGTHNRSGM